MTEQAAWARLTNPLVARAYHSARYRQLPDFPRSLIIESTSRCNLRCRMCPRGSMTRRAQDMPRALFDGLLDQIAEHDRRDVVDFVALHWFGEPLLHPDLLGFLERAGRRLPNLRRRGHLRCAVRGLCLSINATLLDSELAQGLLDSPLTWLGLSVDGSSAETYATMREGGVFEQVAANVERLLALGRRRPREFPTIAIQVIVTRTTRPELAACLRRWEKHLAGIPHARVELKPYTDWAGQVCEPELEVPNRRRHFLYLNCGYLWDTMAVGAGGEVGLCCYDVNASHGLGNAGQAPLQEIWHGEPLTALRQRHARGELKELPLCRNCRMGRKYPLDYLWRRRRP